VFTGTSDGATRADGTASFDASPDTAQVVVITATCVTELADAGPS
jgi:hypothetical protein